MLFNQDRRKNRDRRATPRTPASGPVTLWIDTPVRSSIAAEWVETSATGFRATHDSMALEPGLELSYEGGGISGRARVMWTHVLDGRRVSGFILL